MLAPLCCYFLSTGQWLCLHCIFNGLDFVWDWESFVSSQSLLIYQWIYYITFLEELSLAIWYLGSDFSWEQRCWPSFLKTVEVVILICCFILYSKLGYVIAFLMLQLYFKIKSEEMQVSIQNDAKHAFSNQFLQQKPKEMYPEIHQNLSSEKGKLCCR